MSSDDNVEISGVEHCWSAMLYRDNTGAAPHTARSCTGVSATARPLVTAPALVTQHWCAPAQLCDQERSGGSVCNGHVNLSDICNTSLR